MARGRCNPKRPAEPDLLLVLNSAEERLQIVLGRLDPEDNAPALLAARELVVPGQAMARLLPSLENMLAELELPASRVARLACVRGPGSFTGIRLVLATALGLARSLDRPLAGLDYLPLLAAGVLPLVVGEKCSWRSGGMIPPAAGGVPQHPVQVLTHARRGQVHLQGFAATGPLGPPLALSIEAAAERLAETPEALLLGSGLRRQEAFFAERLPRAARLPRSFDHPRPEILLEHGAAAPASSQPIEPLYLRPSDAEENLARIAEGRGMSAEDAQARLDALRF